MLQDLVWAAAYHTLLTVHDSAHQAVFCWHKSLLQEESFVVPRYDPTAQFVTLSYIEGPAVTNGGGPHHHVSFEGPRRFEDAVTCVEREAGEVALPQVSSIVHVAHVDVPRGDPAWQDLLCGDVPDWRLKPGPQDHRGRPHEVPHIHDAEESQQGGENPQHPPHVCKTGAQIIKYICYCDIQELSLVPTNQQNKTINWSVILKVIKKLHFFKNLQHILLLSISSHLFFYSC